MDRKNRNSPEKKSGGGIGIPVHESVVVTDNNLNKSSEESMEKL